MSYPPPPQPPNGGYSPHQPYGAYPPPYGQPRRSKAPLWIGISVGVVAILGLAFHFIAVDNAWLHPAPTYTAPLTPEQREAYSYVPPAGAAAPAAAPAAAAPPIVGRWCSGGTYVQFEPNGGVYDSRANMWGRWREVGVSNLNMTMDARTVALHYSVHDRLLLLTTTEGMEQRLTRC